MKLAGHVARMEKRRGVEGFGDKITKKKAFVRSRRRLKDDIKIDL
jgi:hypothetical protein